MSVLERVVVLQMSVFMTETKRWWGLKHLQIGEWIKYLDTSLSLVYTQKSEIMLLGKVKYTNSIQPFQTCGLIYWK